MQSENNLNKYLNPDASKNTSKSDIEFVEDIIGESLGESDDVDSNNSNEVTRNGKIDVLNLDSLKLEEIAPVTKDQYLKFLELLKKAKERFNQIPKDETIRLISHLDADGITSASLIINAILNEGRKYELEIVSQLTDEKCEEFAKEDYKYYIITDLGSSQMKSVVEYMSEKNIIILDHHTPQEAESLDNILNVNPHFADIDGSSEISGSGVVFFFSCVLNPKNYTMGHIALIGAIGDVQENKGFTGLNNIIRDIAVEETRLCVKQELNFFGKQTRPLFKLLEFSSDLNIPGITGCQEKSVLFLNQIGIKQTKEDGSVKKFVDLTEDERRILRDNIMVKRIQAGLTDHDKVFSMTYELVDEDEGTFKDAKEFSTLLNACGRMDQAKVGVYACLNELGFKKDALDVQKDYKKEIVHGMTWIEKHMSDSESIMQSDKFMLIKAQTNILYTMIGTVASILTMSNKYPHNFLVLSLAHNSVEKSIKVSLRVVGNDEKVDLQKMITQIIEDLGDGEAGGHKHAAGAIIPIDKEDEFIKVARAQLEKFDPKVGNVVEGEGSSNLSSGM
jgi:RecJ-like exonuclease